ncbi:MAG: hypothetical protein II350_03070 [Clostridia bacterium]|nr:hypothetical protein [Clostridia bacterium]
MKSEFKLHPDELWREYSEGVDYNESIGLYENVRKNENFFIGNQWEGVNAPDLEKPVLNVLKRCVSYFLAMLSSDDIAVNIEPFDEGEITKLTSNVLSGEIVRVSERAGLKEKFRDMLRNCCVDGDGCVYFFMDNRVKTGSEEEGEIRAEVLENTKVIFGNPYVSDVQSQPYIIVVQRMLKSEAEELARENGSDPQSIIPDAEDGRYVNEDMDRRNNLVTVLTRFWKEDGEVWCCKASRGLIIKKPFKLGYTLYPIAYMSWEKIRSSYHGQAVITGLIPNQIYINRLWAMAMQYVKLCAFPTMLYDQTRVSKWTNRIGQAVGVRGNPNDAIASAFRPGDMSFQVFELVDRTVQYTKDCIGASDAALGSVRPDNTSAIIAVQKANAVPLELQRLSYFGFVENCIRIIIEMMRVDYGIRTVKARPFEGGEKQYVFFDFSVIAPESIDLKIDVGSSSYWSELTQIQTLDNLYRLGIIADAETYIESLPEGFVPNREFILKKLKEAKNGTDGLNQNRLA